MSRCEEPTVIINGKALTVGQALTLRVALGSFLATMEEKDSLGSDEHGRAMRENYLARGAEIMRQMIE